MRRPVTFHLDSSEVGLCSCSRRYRRKVDSCHVGLMLGRLVLIWLNRKVHRFHHIVCFNIPTICHRLVNVELCSSMLSLQFCTSSEFPSIRHIHLYWLHPSCCRLEVTIWVVPSLLENALAISAIGFLLGPMFPILMSYCTQVLPKWLLTGCLGWIGGIGQAGSAVLPFVTGLLASKFGIGSLQPL